MTIEERLREILNDLGYLADPPEGNPNPLIGNIWDDLNEVVCDMERERLGVVKAS